MGWLNRPWLGDSFVRLEIFFEKKLYFKNFNWLSNFFSNSLHALTNSLYWMTASVFTRHFLIYSVCSASHSPHSLTNQDPFCTISQLYSLLHIGWMFCHSIKHPAVVGAALKGLRKYRNTASVTHNGSRRYPLLLWFYVMKQLDYWRTEEIGQRL